VIRTRAAGMVRAVRASSCVRFQAVGQRDADHGVEILSGLLLVADSSALAQLGSQAIHAVADSLPGNGKCSGRVARWG
jgi:hypothetical protein